MKKHKHLTLDDRYTIQHSLANQLSFKAISVCDRYEKALCTLLTKAPYVYNGCTRKRNCTLEKHMHNAYLTHMEYTEVLRESRSGFNLTEEDYSISIPSLVLSL